MIRGSALRSDHRLAPRRGAFMMEESKPTLMAIRNTSNWPLRPSSITGLCRCVTVARTMRPSPGASGGQGSMAVTQLLPERSISGRLTKRSAPTERLAVSIQASGRKRRMSMRSSGEAVSLHRTSARNQ